MSKVGYACDRRSEMLYDNGRRAREPFCPTFGPVHVIMSTRSMHDCPIERSGPANGSRIVLH